MAQYIPKDALVAEIERLKKTEGWCQVGKDTADVYYARGFRFACERIISFLDTMEVKEVDLDSNIRTYLTNHFNIYEDGVLQSKKSGLPLSTYDIIKVAEHFYSLRLSQKGE